MLRECHPRRYRRDPIDKRIRASGLAQDPFDLADLDPVDVGNLADRHAVLQPGADACEVRRGNFRLGRRSAAGGCSGLTARLAIDRRRLRRSRRCGRRRGGGRPYRRSSGFRIASFWGEQRLGCLAGALATAWEPLARPRAICGTMGESVVIHSNWKG
jgi:hypothetical protein